MGRPWACRAKMTKSCVLRFQCQCSPGRGRNQCSEGRDGMNWPRLALPLMPNRATASATKRVVAGYARQLLPDGLC